jgi:small-conductance mechanosensitive channel
MSFLQEILESNPYLKSAVIVLGSVVVAFVVNWITAWILKNMAGKTRSHLDDQILQVIRRPLFVTVVIVGCNIAFEPLKLPETGLYIFKGILITIAVMLWAGALMRVSKLVLSAWAGHMDKHRMIQPRTLPLFEMVLKIVWVVGAVYGILLAWKIDVTAWLASAGILGIAIGFAAKDTLANLFSGIFIIADAPYKLGDFIVLNSGERGMVTDIGIRTTRILTRDDIQIIVPNAAIANAKIVNETGGPYEKQRVRISVGVAYGSDVDKVRQVLIDVADKSEYLEQDPEPRVRFRQLGESSLDFQLMGWIKTPELRGRAIDELNSAVYKRFMEEKIEIPFPQRVVHLSKD